MKNYTVLAGRITPCTPSNKINIAYISPVCQVLFFTVPQQRTYQPTVMTLIPRYITDTITKPFVKILVWTFHISNYTTSCKVP